MLTKSRLSLSLVTLLGVTLLTCSVGLGQPPWTWTAQPKNFSPNGPISGTNVVVDSEITGFPGPPYMQILADLAGYDNLAVRCEPHTDNEFTIPIVNGHWKGTVTIASTHHDWYDGLGGTLRLEMLSGALSQAIPGITVHNRATVTGMHSWSPTGAHGVVTSVQTKCEAMRHTVTPSCTNPSDGPGDCHMSRDEAQIEAEITPSTTFFIMGHGYTNPSDHKFWFCDNLAPVHVPPPETDEGWITEGEVETAVARKQAEFNPDLPPYNFVFIHTCYSADSASPALSWGMCLGREDEAYFGWDGMMVNWGDYNTYVATFFADLEQGNWAIHAMQEAEWAYPQCDNGVVWGDVLTRLYWPYGSSYTFW